MIIIKKQQLDEIINHSLKEAPAEACGLLVGKNENITKVFPMTNEKHSSTRYLVNPKEQFVVFKQMRKEELDLLGIYHSHPASGPYPSKTDCELAVYDVAYFIISLENKEPMVEAFKINNGVINKEQFEVKE